MLMTCADTDSAVCEAPAERPDAFPATAYKELRRMARRHLLRERKGHTLSATGLVHETWLKLASGREQKFVNRAHFFGAASEAMRRILVDHARGRSARKRHAERVSLTAAGELADIRPAFHDMLAVYSALQDLAAFNERLVRVVESRVLCRTDDPGDRRRAGDLARDRVGRLALCPGVASARTLHGLELDLSTEPLPAGSEPCTDRPPTPSGDSATILAMNN